MVALTLVGCSGPAGDEGPRGTGGDSGVWCPDGVPIDAMTPDLVGADPASGAELLWSSWLTLTFGEPIEDPVLCAFTLTCDGGPQEVTSHRLEDVPETVVVNPRGNLPFGASCTLDWPGPQGTETLSFSVSQALPKASVPYDRSDPSRYAPFPDDTWLTPDSSSPTGVALPVPARELDVTFLFSRLNEVAGSPDGFSPVGALVVELSDAPHPRSLPRTATESLDPLATIGLFDVDTDSASYAKRIPFKLHIRSIRTSSTPEQHALVIFPSIPLEPNGRYGLVVTRRALATQGQPYEPSAFMQAALGEPTAGEDRALGDVRALVDDVLTATSSASPPIFEDDVAMVTRFTVRSTDAFPTAPLAMRAQVAELPQPSFAVESVRPGVGAVEAIVEGTWEAPEWRDGNNMRRNQDGLPVVVGTKRIPFVLALPSLATTEPVPIVIYQHGNPGSAEVGVPVQAERYLAENGFAVIGFTDTITREVGSDPELQTRAILEASLTSGALPDYWLQSTGEQLALLRMISALGVLDEVPPYGQPDLDVTAPLNYVGISEGANKGQALVPYAPEIRAAALVVGGARLGEVLFYQDEVGLDGLGTRNLDLVNDQLAPNARSIDLWIAWALFQLGFDPQDPHNHAAFMYDRPLEVGGTSRKPSVLVQEGIGDTLIPNNATRSLAYTLGQLPQLDPIAERVPLLPRGTGTVRANIDSQTTAAYTQFVPAGVAGLATTPGCELEPEGHDCAQIAPASLAQRTLFFRSAVDDAVPTITP